MRTSSFAKIIDCVLQDFKPFQPWSFVVTWFVKRFDEAVRTRLIDDFGEALGLECRNLRDDLMDEIHRLELQIAELKGEVKGLRAERSSRILRPDDA